jgi:thymidine phosphorylase
VASILSKKLAAGLEALVMDVKFGSGAFLPARDAAEELARALVEVAGGAGLPTVALLTDMDEVLGATAGNAVEVREAIDYLTGAAREPRLHEVTLGLTAALLEQGGLTGDGRAAAQRALDSGAAAERFAAMVAALGGPADVLEAPERHLAAARVVRAAAPERAGVVVGMDCRAVGLVVTGLGGNRRREDDVIDPAVGLTEIAPTGAQVGPDRPLAVVHAASEAAADEAIAALRAAVRIRDEAPPERPAVAGRIA